MAIVYILQYNQLRNNLYCPKKKFVFLVLSGTPKHSLKGIMAITYILQYNQLRNNLYYPRTKFILLSVIGDSKA